MSISGGRAASGSRERPPEEGMPSASAAAAGRAKVSYRGAAPSTGAVPAPGQPVAAPVEPSRASAGRGASRGREQREVIVTRPSPTFSKEGKNNSVKH